MLKSMIRKEVRELLPIVVIALLAQLIAISDEIGVAWYPDGIFSRSGRGGTIPFVSESSFVPSLVIGAIAAIALGLWQTTVDSRRGTLLFLFHRPASREAILGAKMLVGVVLTLLIIWIPLVGYAVWAAVPGTHASPFYWSMTGWAWNLSLLWPVIYLGAFLSGLRSASWYRSRYWPLVAAMACLPILYVTFWPDSWSHWFMPLGVAAMVYGFVLAIGNVGRTRNYS
jgi:hypothetical protein